MINLETAVGDGKLTQSFDPESLKAKDPFTNRECESSALSDSESKSWATLPSRTAVSRINGKIESIAFGGEGILRHEGHVIFVPFTASGDEAEVEIISQKKNFARGKLRHLDKKSLLRTEPRCPYFGACGGCQLQHLNYQAQVEAKRMFIIDALQRIGKIDVTNIKITVIPSQQQWNYRRHVRLKLKNEGTGFNPETAVSGFNLGYTGIDNITFIPITQCPIFLSSEHPLFVKLAPLLASLSNEGIEEASLRLIKTEEGQVLLIFSFSPHLPKNYLICEQALNLSPGILMHSPLEQKQWGKIDCHTHLLGLTLRFSAFGFLQNHPEQSENLYRAILKELPSKSGKILDLYCGIGLTSLLFAKAGWKTIGVESHKETVALAQENAIANTLKVQFLEGKAEVLGRDLLKKEHPDVVLCNPPRTGIHPRLIQALLEEKPVHILYVSCMPGTLARDLAKLLAGGYHIDHIQGFDMFPQTTHVETLVRLTL